MGWGGAVNEVGCGEERGCRFTWCFLPGARGIRRQRAGDTLTDTAQKWEGMGRREKMGALEIMSESAERAGSRVKSDCCSLRGPEFDSQRLH